MRDHFSQPTQNLMIVGQFICGRSRTDHLLSHHTAAIHLIRILPNSLGIFEPFQIVENQLAAWVHNER